MKHVTFTRDMRPQRAGEQRLLPDDVAARLEADGVIAPNPPDWPEGPQPSVPAEPSPATNTARDRRGRQRYPTK